MILAQSAGFYRCPEMIGKREKKELLDKKLAYVDFF